MLDIFAGFVQMAHQMVAERKDALIMFEETKIKLDTLAGRISEMRGYL